MLLIGSHVNYKKDGGLLGCVEQSIEYGASTFMFYTGAPQNTMRSTIDKKNVEEAIELMKKNNIDKEKVIIHAPYIINLANEEKYSFAVSFLKQEIKRCEELKMKYLVLHPGSHVGSGVDTAIKRISRGLNEVLKDSSVTILLETMAGKGTEVGKNFDEIREIIEKTDNKEKIGVCMDTCHLNDAGYDIANFDEILKEFDKIIGLKYLKCIHINDSKNKIATHKDRHANIGFGEIGFDSLIKVIYHEKLKDIPKILETPYIGEKAPYKEEIRMIKEKKFDALLLEKITNTP